MKILIVDDELIERDGIVFLIDKFQLDLEVTLCSDGEEALSYLKDNQVDILLTDIKMPFMDGLQLSKHARMIYPELKIIIFSGYGDFEYAKTSISLGVSDYILKPINPDEFKKTMIKVMNEVRRNKQETENKKRIIAIEKEHIVYKILNGTSIESIKDKFNLHSKISFINNYKKMVLIQFNQEFFQDNIKFYEQIKKYIQTQVDYVNVNPQQSVLCLYHDINNFRLTDLCNKLHNIVKNKYNIDCYFAISESISDPRFFNSEFSKLEQLIEERFFVPNNFVFYKDMELALEDTDDIFDNNMLMNIRNDLEARDYYSLRKHIKYLCKKYIAKKSFSQMYVKYIFSTVYEEIYQSLKMSDENELNNEIDTIYKCKTIPDILVILNNLIAQIEQLVPNKNKNNRHEVDLVKEYISKHFGEDLTLDTLANHVYMTPSYLSSIFKKETGVGLNNYIKNFRMNKAKELLKNTNIKIKDIGNTVGYNNISYFCQSFRRVYGVTPEKYRQKGEDNE